MKKLLALALLVSACTDGSQAPSSGLTVGEAAARDAADWCAWQDACSPLGVPDTCARDVEAAQLSSRDPSRPYRGDVDALEACFDALEDAIASVSCSPAPARCFP